MKLTPDTNLLVRAIVRDDERQAEIAARTLRQAEVIELTLPALCEFVWVLRSIYRFERQDLEVALRTLLQIRNVALDRPAVEAGLASLQAGADFADGLIAHEGRHLGGEVFVSFDKKAVKIATEQGQKAHLAT